ncbi:cytochrome c maturation protein CcmE [Candidatus Binatia bacterium]|nr:cytochrome c maturation protein CcmE [Candidatus Binatia bacterium]
MSRKLKFLVGASVIVLAVATLIYSAVRETSAYFMTVDEYAKSVEAHAGKQLRLAGRVSNGSVKWDPKTLDLEFLIRPIPAKEAAANAVAHSGGTKTATVTTTDAEAALITVPVRYNGILPDMFAADRDVIVEGKVENGVFHAKTLLTACPSKYESDQYKENAQDAPASDQRAALDPAAAAGAGATAQ